MRSLLQTIAVLPALLSLSSAFPVEPRADNTTAATYNPSLPNVLILGTGGTIAGSASDSGSVGYTAGAISIDTLVEAVPELLNVSNVASEQIANVGSPNVNSTVLLELARRSNEALCSENAEYDGVVVTHGTDTTEETAFFLDLTVNCGKPVIVVGAMRPATAVSPDGPANLLEAVTLAGSKAAKDRGSMIVLNDRICSSFYCRKTNANNLDTFKAIEQGFIGGFLNYKPFFYYEPSKPTFKNTFDVSGLTSLPKVDILHGHQEFDGDLVTAAVDAGVKGIVIAGTGSGGVSSTASPNIEAAIKANVPVVSTSKTGSGASPPSSGESEDDEIAGGYLVPTHARIQLQLGLATGKSMSEIRSMFEDKLLGYLEA